MCDDESTQSHREKKTIKANVEAVEATNVSKCHNVRLESLTRNGPMDFLHLLTVAGQLLVPCLSCSLQMLIMLAGMGHSKYLSNATMMFAKIHKFCCTHVSRINSCFFSCFSAGDQSLREKERHVPINHYMYSKHITHLCNCAL